MSLSLAPLEVNHTYPTLSTHHGARMFGLVSILGSTKAFERFTILYSS